MCSDIEVLCLQILHCHVTFSSSHDVSRGFLDNEPLSNIENYRIVSLYSHSLELCVHHFTTPF